MTEGINFIPESELNKKTSGVIIMYPDQRTTGGGKLTKEELSGTFEESFLDTATNILSRYKRQNIKINGVVFADTLPTQFSSFYPEHLFDNIVALRIGFMDWKSASHLDLLQEIYSDLSIDDSGSVVVGGYHAFDCVVDMTRVLEAMGRKVEPNLLLTDQLGELLVQHSARRILAPNDVEERGREREVWRQKYDHFQKLVRSEDIFVGK